jgi:hypothetical protein
MKHDVDWQSISEDSPQRMHALRQYADFVFQSPEAAIRWLTTTNVAIGTGQTPAAACRTAQGFFEAMADLARIQAIRHRGWSKSAKTRAEVIPLPTVQRSGGERGIRTLDKPFEPIRP